MPIHAGILKKHAEKHVIIMNGDQTLDDFQIQFEKSGYPINGTYLVVSLPSNQYFVDHLFDLDDTLVNHWTQPLSSLPLSPASRVEHVNTPENGKSIVDWVEKTPNSTLVVIDDSGFVALLANTDRPGGSRNTGTGILGQLGQKKKK